MTTLVFDTHAFIKRPRNAGFTEEQAKIFADEQRKPMEGRLATRRDIKELETRLEARTTELEAETVQWMIGLLSVRAGGIIAMVEPVAATP